MEQDQTKKVWPGAGGTGGLRVKKSQRAPWRLCKAGGNARLLLDRPFLVFLKRSEILGIMTVKSKRVGEEFFLLLFLSFCLAGEQLFGR